MHALFGKVDVPEFLISSLFVKTLVSFVLGKSIQSDRDKPVFPGMVFCKIHHLLGKSFPLKVWVHGKPMDVNTVSVGGKPLNGFVFFIHQRGYDDGALNRVFFLQPQKAHHVQCLFEKPLWRDSARSIEKYRSLAFFWHKLGLWSRYRGFQISLRVLSLIRFN